jgi:hypothetical protein
VSELEEQSPTEGATISKPDAYTRVAHRGRSVTAAYVDVCDRRVVVTGRLLRVATIQDEEFVAGAGVADASVFISAVKESGLRADILSFAQRIDERTPKYSYRYEWDNAAVAFTGNSEAWWSGLSQETRKNVRRAAKKGVDVQVVPFNDALVDGIKRIYDETPIRQGRWFWHFGKPLERVREENASYLEKSEFLGAYLDGELIGFMKWVYVDNSAVMMQILAKACHQDKRPVNALIAKAVEVCHQKGMRHLVYSKFTFGNKRESAIAEFKRRNGFVQLDFPRYYVPLTTWGSVALILKLHRGLLEILPPRMIRILLALRSRLLQHTIAPTGRTGSQD